MLTHLIFNHSLRPGGLLNNLHPTQMRKPRQREHSDSGGCPHRGLTAPFLPSRDRGRPGQRKSNHCPGCRQGLQPERQLQKLRSSYISICNREISPRRSAATAASATRPCASSLTAYPAVHLPCSSAPVRTRRATPPPDHPAQLLLRGQGEAQLPGAPPPVPDRPPVQVGAAAAPQGAGRGRSAHSVFRCLLGYHRGRTKRVTGICAKCIVIIHPSIHSSIRLCIPLTSTDLLCCAPASC